MSGISCICPHCKHILPSCHNTKSDCSHHEPWCRLYQKYCLYKHLTSISGNVKKVYDKQGQLIMMTRTV